MALDTQPPLNSLGFAKSPAETRVVVAMSGGVDSSVVAAHLAEQGDLVGRCSGFAGNANARGIIARLQRFPEIEVDDFVRDAVTDLVWMAFRNTFTGEKKICWGQNSIRSLE